MFSHTNLHPPTDFATWIEQVRPQLKPPVGNKIMFGGQQKVMVVGGPNTREDYHIEQGEELFFQLVGDMVLETMEHGQRKPVRIPQGHIFALPGRIPHSPQRLAGTVGLVIERDRVPGELDGLRYYTRDGSGNVLFEEWFHCTDLGTQLKPVIDRFFASECYKTGIPDREFPPPPLELDTTTALMTPVRLSDWVAAHTGAASTRAVLCGPGAVDPSLAGFEFTAAVYTGAHPDWAPADGGFILPLASEVFLYGLPGSAEAVPAEPTRVLVKDGTSGQLFTFGLPAGHVLLVPGGKQFSVRVEFATGGPGVLVTTNAAFKQITVAAFHVRSRAA